MLKRARIYLDTSVPNLHYGDRYPDRMQETREFWEVLKNYEVIISPLVEAELRKLESIDVDRAQKTLQLIEPLERVSVMAEVDELAKAYMAAKAFRPRAELDAQHVAIATVQQARYLVSWNYKDLVNLRSRAKINAVNIEQGYAFLEIVTPPEFLGGV